MLNHRLCNPNTPKGHVMRRIITVCILKGIRAISLSLLKCSNFKKTIGINGDTEWRYMGYVGCEDGLCKNSGGGERSTDDVPTSFDIFKEDLRFNVNPFNLLQSHREVCDKFTTAQDWFFLAPLYIIKTNCLLKAALIVITSFSKYFYDVSEAFNVRGVGFQDKPKLQSLRAMIITNIRKRILHKGRDIGLFQVYKHTLRYEVSKK